MVGVAGTAALFRPAHTHTCVCIYLLYFFYFDALQLAQMNWPRLERVVVVVTDNNMFNENNNPKQFNENNNKKLAPDLSALFEQSGRLSEYCLNNSNFKFPN